MGDRHQFRADWHDYNGGIYFVTICSHEKRHTFGSIVGTRFFASALGSIIEEHLNRLPTFYDDVKLWNRVIMPNHVHVVIAVGTRFFASTETDTDTKTETVTDADTNKKIGCLKPPRHGDPLDDFHHNSRLATIIGAFKAGVTRTVRTRKIASLPCWQSRFHEHIIRNQRAFDNIMHYIDTNIENWNKDCFYE